MKKYSQSGVALLMSLAILALLSVVGIAFATNMRLMERTTRDFVYEVQARYIAEGGIEYAVAQLKNDARNNFVFSGINGVGNNDVLNTAIMGLPQGASLSVEVIDTGRQININNANANLLRCLPGDDISQNIVNKRADLPGTGNKFLTKQSVCQSDGISNPNTNTDSLYHTIKEYITTDTYIDPNVQDETGNPDATDGDRSAININALVNSAKNGDVFAEEILQNIFKVVDGIGDTLAENIVSMLKNPPLPYTLPIESWAEFNGIIDQVSGIGPTLSKRIDDMFNPNRQKPSVTYATEFCFHSGGTYEITATGVVRQGTQTLASKTISATTKIFDLWNQTTKEQFQADIDMDWDGQLDANEDINGNAILDEPIYSRVTWLDSCPVNIDISYPTSGYDIALAETINDSIKLGFWEDFDLGTPDNPPTTANYRWRYSRAQWYRQQGKFLVKEDEPLKNAIRASGSPGDVGFEFYSRNGVLQFPILCLGRTELNYSDVNTGFSSAVTDRWKWSEFSLRLYLWSYDGVYNSSGGNINDWTGPFPVTYRLLGAREGSAWRKYDIGSHILLKRRSESPFNISQRDVSINQIDPWEWDRNLSWTFADGMSCGRWDLDNNGEFELKGRWYAYENPDPTKPKWGISNILEHEGTYGTSRIGYTKNNDVNKNLSPYPNHNLTRTVDGVTFVGYYDNDDPFKNTGNDIDVNSDLVNNIEDTWNNIYYKASVFPKNSYLCIGGIPETTIGGKYVEDGSNSGKLGDGVNNKYYEAGNYNVLYKKQNGRDILSVNASLFNYNKNNNGEITDTIDSVTVTKDTGTNIPDGNIALYGSAYGFVAKNIRIIGDSGYYESIPFDFKIEDELGTIWGTQTIPESADSDSERLAFQYMLGKRNVDGTITWLSSWLPSANDINLQIQPTGRGITDIEEVRDVIKYKANLVTSDPDFSETPVLEDVWITYLPKARVFYWREG